MMIEIQKNLKIIKRRNKGERLGQLPPKLLEMTLGKIVLKVYISFKGI
jgi:hypothetical protein